MQMLLHIKEWVLSIEILIFSHLSRLNSQPQTQSHIFFLFFSLSLSLSLYIYIYIYIYIYGENPFPSYNQSIQRDLICIIFQNSIV